MPYTSGVFDDVEYRSDIFADMFAGLISDGVNGTNSAYLQVTENSNMVVTIQDGYAWIAGHVFRVIGGENLTVATADGALDRIDRVVLRYDKRDYPYIIYPLVLTGGLSDNPVPPDLMRTDDVYDLCLAEIYVDAGTTTITQDLIADKRGDNTVCGYVYGLSTDIDTSTIFAQYDAKLLQLITDLGVHDNVTINITSDASKVRGIPITTAAPKIGQTLKYDGANIIYDYAANLDLLYSGSGSGGSVIILAASVTDYKFLIFSAYNTSGNASNDTFIHNFPAGTNIYYAAAGSSHLYCTIAADAKTLTIGTTGTTTLKIWGCR